MTTTPPPHVAVHLSRRAALQLVLGGLLSTALAACSSKSSASGADGSTAKPLDPAKLASFLTGTWNFTITRDFRDGSTAPSTHAGTIKITGNSWDLQLGQGKAKDDDVIPVTDEGNGNANGTWQTATDSVAISPTYGTGPFFGQHGDSWWSTLTASGLLGTPHDGQQESLPWNPTLTGNDPDMSVNPGTLAVHVQSSRKITLTHTANPTGDPDNPTDPTVTTIQASKQ